MSYQHFYSRVPARVSLYNKRDGFDTFAQSSMLDRGFVLGELSMVYADKLSIHSPIDIRHGRVPVVYSQAFLPSGRVAQTAISYIPFDFTGERSAYLAHTLVLTDEEKRFVFYNPAADMFNPSMFVTDVSQFNLTAPNAIANAACQDAYCIPRPVADHMAHMAAFDPEMVKSFIYSLLLSVCDGGRSVYFRLPGDDITASARAVDFINSIMSILPYTLRERLSFVSYVSDVSAYQGYHLKGAGAGVTEVPSELGSFYDFASGTVSGQPADYNKGAAYASFLYALYKYPKIKDTFHAFVENIVENCTFRLDMKAMKELCFLFWQCSGFYVEQSVLPTDDAISDFLDIYVKYREGLHAPYRVQAFKFLQRYAQEQRIIPDNVFSRISDLYPTECVEARAVILDVLLKIIHLDLMRDTIFCFVTRNYYTETDSVKAVIMANLCSVFYGGFLQQNILAFFDLQFRSEPVATRDIILDKLLLSIRTPEIQRQVVVFIDRHYGLLNATQKLKVCSTCLEMIPECDGLSVLLVSLVNRRVGRGAGDVPKLVGSRLSDMLAYYLSYGDGRLASIFVDTPGVCEDIVFRHALNQATGTEIIISILAAMPAAKRTDKLIRAYKLAEGMPGAYEALIQRFATVPVVVLPTTLVEVMQQDSLAQGALPASVIDLFRHMVIYPAFLFTLPEAFLNPKEGSLDSAIKYAEHNPTVRASREYKLITDYLDLVKKCQIGDNEGAFKLILGLPQSAELRTSIAKYMQETAYKPDFQEPETTFSFELVIRYLTTGGFKLDEMYHKYQEFFEESYRDDGMIKGIKADTRGASAAIELVLTAAADICDVTDELAEKVMDDSSGLREAMASFIAFYGPGSGRILKKHSKDAYFEIEELASEMIEDRKSQINSVGDAMNYLFRKNQ